MREVPRELFVAESLAAFAHDDTPLPIEAGQTISQPYIVALTIAAAGIGPGDRVLEIGAGSGYAAAILSRIAGEVVAIASEHDYVAGTKRGPNTIFVFELGGGQGRQRTMRDGM